MQANNNAGGQENQMLTVAQFQAKYKSKREVFQ
jgi:hypothetical protein